MNHLYTFNEAKKSLYDDNMVSKITLEEYREVILEKFTKPECEKIKQIISEYVINYKRGDIIDITTYRIDINGVPRKPEIEKGTDEYYYVNLNGSWNSDDEYYKCDQMEGLENFIRTKLLKSYKRIDVGVENLKLQIKNKLDKMSIEELKKVIDKLT